jgi:hypothetical protein
MNVHQRELKNREYEKLHEDPDLRERRSTRLDRPPVGNHADLVHYYSPAEFRNNVMALAKLGKVFNLPTVLTTSLGQGPNGAFIPEVLSLFPDVPVIDRPGIISAWDDPAFVTALRNE